MKLPRVDDVLAAPPLAAHHATYKFKKWAVQRHLAALRADRSNTESVTTAAVARCVADTLTEMLQVHPQPRINATGVVLHTNLGRAPLAAEAVAAVVAAAGACDLEIDPRSGQRSSRLQWLRPLLQALFGAEDAHVVNNGAAALLLACAAVASPGGVALARGQMVEIGDGFRVADMAGAAGTTIHAVGSTNRTHLADYEAALDAGATAILWVHLSNFVQLGFVHQPGLRELKVVAARRGVPLIADLGSGAVEGMATDEPTIQAYLAAGADLVTCSGDKLLGGPQAGFLAGRADLVAHCRRHPLARALRPDKLAIAGMHATASLYLQGEQTKLPVHALVSATPQALQARAEALVDALGWSHACIHTTEACIGGGAAPGTGLESRAIAVPTTEPHAVAQALRCGNPSVIARIHAGAVLLDLRSVPCESDAAIVAALQQGSVVDRLTAAGPRS